MGQVKIFGLKEEQNKNMAKMFELIRSCILKLQNVTVEL